MRREVSFHFTQKSRKCTRDRTRVTAAVFSPVCALHVPGRETTEPALALTPRGAWWVVLKT